MSGVLHFATAREQAASPAAFLVAQLTRKARPHLLIGPGVVDVGDDFGVKDALVVFDLQRLLLREVARLRAPLLLVSYGERSLILGHLATRGVDGIARAHWHQGAALSALARNAAAGALVVDDIAAALPDVDVDNGSAPVAPQPTEPETSKKTSQKKSSKKSSKKTQKKTAAQHMTEAWAARIDRLLGPAFDDEDRLRLGRRRRRRR